MKKKLLKVVGLVGAVLLIALAVFLYYDLPVYYQFLQEVDSFSALREKLEDCDATRQMVLVDPAAFGAASTGQSLEMSDQNRLAKPVGYGLGWRKTQPDGSLIRYGVSGEIARPDNKPDGENYRGWPAELEVFQDEPQKRILRLRLLCGGFCYGISTTCDLTGLSEQARADLEASAREELYAIADYIIDRAEKDS